VEVYDRNSPVSVIAIHGGELEKATSVIARNIAGKDFNLYLFNAWLGKASRKLHVTASHFNDSRVFGLIAKSSVTVSVHAQADKGEIVCVGGANEKLKKMVSDFLSATGFETEFPCKRFPALTDKNIVNKSGGGVQLEITLALLNELDKDRDKLLKFSNIVKNALEEYIKAENRDERVENRE